MSSIAELGNRGQNIDLFGLVTRWATYLLFFLVPIFFLPWTTNVLENNKQLLFVVLIVIGLVAWLGQMVVTKTFTFKSGWFNLVPGFYVLAVLIASFTSLAGYQTWVGQSAQEYVSFLSIALFIVLFYLLLNTAQDTLLQRNVLMALFLSAGISGLITLLGMFNVVHLPFEFAQSIGFNTIGTMNGFVSFMTVMMFIGLAMWLVSQEGRDRVIPLGGGGVFLRVLIVLVTLVNLLGLIALDFWVFWLINIVGVLLLGTFVFIQSQEFPNMRRFALPLLVLFMSILFLFLPTPLHLNLPIVVSPSYGTSWNITKQVLSSDTSNLLFGSGPGTYLYDYLLYKPVGVNASQFWSLRFDRAKSDLMTTLGTLGVVGTFFWVVLMLWVGVKAVGRLVFERDHEEWKMTYVLFTGWAVLLLTHVLYSSNFTMTFLLWGFTGLLASKVSLKFWKSDFSRSPRLGLVTSFAFAIVAVMVVASLFVTGSRYAAEVAFATAVELDTSGEGSIDEVIAQLNRAVLFNGLSDVYERNLSSAYLMKARELIAASSESERTSEQTQVIVDMVTASVSAAARATEIEPSYVSNWVMRGSIYRDLMSFAQGAEDLAAQSFLNAISLEPNNPLHRTNLGRVYLTVADRARSLKSAEDPELAAQASEQEVTLLASAEAMFLKATELKSDYLPAHYYLAATYEREGKLEQAAARLVALRNNNPTDIGLAFQLSQMLIRLEEYEIAQQELERIVALNPNYSNALWYLASMYEISGEREKAIEIIKQVVVLNPSNDVAKARLVRLKSGESTTGIPEPIQSGQSGSIEVDAGEVVEEVSIEGESVPVEETPGT
ncbi:tetratricopeptide repeat protein [Candidatus Uhrbacteria bacterium]|nr:tetratricopeptide repeat protein [Candidatus Uhrbacteria bacterium]